MAARGAFALVLILHACHPSHGGQGFKISGSGAIEEIEKITQNILQAGEEYDAELGRDDVEEDLEGDNDDDDNVQPLAEEAIDAHTPRPPAHPRPLMATEPRADDPRWVGVGGSGPGSKRKKPKGRRGAITDFNKQQTSKGLQPLWESGPSEMGAQAGAFDEKLTREDVTLDGVPSPAYQFQDQGTHVVFTIQATALMFDVTSIMAKERELFLSAMNVAGQRIQLCLDLLHKVDPAASSWEHTARGGIEIHLAKKNASLRWDRAAKAMPENLPYPAYTQVVPRACEHLDEHMYSKDARCSGALYRANTEWTLYAEDGPAMRDVFIWLDQQGTALGWGQREKLADAMGEPEIGKVFDKDGGPAAVQVRLEAYIQQQGVYNSAAWASWTQLGNCWRALGNPFFAVQSFRKALALKGSDDPDVLLNLALVLQHADHLEDAIPVIERAVLMAPGGMLYRYIRGNLYYETNRFAEALADFKATLLISPDFMPAVERVRELETSNLFPVFMRSQPLLKEALSILLLALCAQQGMKWMNEPTPAPSYNNEGSKKKGSKKKGSKRF